MRHAAKILSLSPLHGWSGASGGGSSWGKIDATAVVDLNLEIKRNNNPDPELYGMQFNS